MVKEINLSKLRISLVEHKDIDETRFAIEFKDNGETVYATLDEWTELIIAVEGMIAMVDERRRIFGD